jgi:hypothetical protein
MCLYIRKKIGCIFSFHGEYEYTFRVIIVPTCPKICCIKRCEITVQYLDIYVLHHDRRGKVNGILGFLITVVLIEKFAPEIGRVVELEMGVTNIGYDLIFDWRVQYTDNKAGGY